MFNKILLTLLTINCSLLTVEAQSQFQQLVGGSIGEICNSMVRTADGGFAAAGQTFSIGAGGSDMYIVKLDSSGALQLSRSIGGAGQDYAFSVIQTTDGGYAAAGQTNSFGAGGYDVYVVKLNSSGTLQWSKTIGGTGYDVAYCIIQTTDGGYAVAAYTDSFGGGGDIYIIKLDANGTIQWNKTIGGPGGEAASSIVQATDGGYVITGYTNSFVPPFYDMYIIKLDATGTIQWSKTIGGALNEFAISIVLTSDGGYAVAGYTNSFGAGSTDVYIVKLESSGTLQWTRTVGGTLDDRCGTVGSIVQTTDGGYAVTGYTYSFGVSIDDIYVIKLDSSGTLQWNRTIGGTGIDATGSIVQTIDGGYAVAGNTSSFGASPYMYIVKLDAGGNTCGNSTSPSGISGTGGTVTSQASTVTTPTSIVTSPTSSSGTGGTVTSICIFVGIQPNSNETPNSFELYQNYPNPFNPSTKIKFALPNNSLANLVVYDALGKEIESIVNGQLNAGIYEVDWNAEKYSSGIYFYRLEASNFVYTKKMVIIK